MAQEDLDRISSEAITMLSDEWNQYKMKGFGISNEMIVNEQWNCFDKNKPLKTFYAMPQQYQPSTAHIQL